LVSAAVVAALALGGCETDNTPYASRAMKPIPEAMLAEMQKKNMAKDSPILVRLFKEEAELEVWKEDRTGHFALLKTYPICRWSGELGPKIREGDRQAPEGFYSITRGQMNPNSEYYLSFNLGYPNAFDQALGRTGSQLMVHGDCSSRGCYAMTDEQITEIYALGRESFFGGQRAFQVQAYPFRMTPANLARHRNSPHFAFWKMLKVGNDHFEATHLEPKVDFCEKRYVFDAASPAGSATPLHFNAKAKCPVYEVPREIAVAVNEKERRDDIQLAELIARRVPTAPVTTGADGGMNPLFAAALGGQEVRDGTGNIRALAALPGTAPTIRLPRDSGPQPAAAPLIRLPGATPEAQPEAETTVASLPEKVPVPRAAPQPKEADAPPAPVVVAQKPSISSRIGGLFHTAKAQAEPMPQPAPPPMQVASAEPAEPAAPVRPAAKPSLFNNLFGPKPQPEPKPEPVPQAQAEPQRPQPPQPKESVTTRVSHAVDLRGSEKPLEILPSAPKPVAAKPAPVAPAHGAIRPVAAPAPAQAQPEPVVREAKAEPVRPPVRTASREPATATFSGGSLMSGAQATVPVGSFR
jgi:murein L,D-transpeptidase YafK